MCRLTSFSPTPHTFFRGMANSKYEYVKNFEKSDALLPNTWIVVRIDGHSFHRFSQLHDFAKPNDRGALELMNEAAKSVMRQFPDCVLGYGVSDEYSFVIRPSYTSYDRRESYVPESFPLLSTLNGTGGSLV